MVNVKLTENQADLVFALVSGDVGRLTERLGVLKAHARAMHGDDVAVRRVNKAIAGTELMISDLEGVLQQMRVECNDGRGKVK